MTRKTTAFVLTKLATGPQTSRELARNAGKSNDQVRHAIRQLRNWGWNIQRNSRSAGYRDKYYLADPEQIQAILKLHIIELNRRIIPAPKPQIEQEDGFQLELAGQEVLV